MLEKKTTGSRGSCTADRGRRRRFSCRLINIVSAEESGKFARILNEECHCDDNEKAILGKIRDIELLKAEMRQYQIIDLLKDESGMPDIEVDKLKLELRRLIQEIKRIKEMPEFKKEGRG